MKLTSIAILLVELVLHSAVEFVPDDPKTPITFRPSAKVQQNAQPAIGPPLAQAPSSCPSGVCPMSNPAFAPSQIEYSSQPEFYSYAIPAPPAASLSSPLLLSTQCGQPGCVCAPGQCMCSPGSNCGCYGAPTAGYGGQCGYGYPMAPAQAMPCQNCWRGQPMSCRGCGSCFGGACGRFPGGGCSGGCGCRGGMCGRR
jgi:hypothetical protein